MKVTIAEDEFLAQQELSWLIKEHSQMEIVGTFDDGLDVLKPLQHSRADAILLDINIPSLDGVLLARNIGQFAHKPFIAFATVWKGHAVEAFELEMFDHILKPYQGSRTTGMLQKLEAVWQRQQTSGMPATTVTRGNNTINLTRDERIIAMPISGIYYAEAHEKMALVYTRYESYIMSMNTTEFCSRPPLSHFFRYHRSSYVNLNKMREIEPRSSNTYIPRLKDLDFEVPVSRSKVKESRQLIYLQLGTFMKAPGLPADQQFFADLFNDPVLDPQLPGHVRLASQPASLPVGSLCIDFPRLDVALRGEYGNLLEARQQQMAEGEMLFTPAHTASLSISNKPVILLNLVFTLTWLESSFYDNRTTPLLHPACQIQFPSLQCGEGEAMFTALTHLNRSLLERNIIRPLVLGLLHLCCNMVNMSLGSSQPHDDFLYHSICNWVQGNYVQSLTHESMTQFSNITPNRLSKLFAQYGTMHFIEYVRWVRMARAGMTLQKYHLSIHEMVQRCDFPDNDYFCRVFRHQLGLTPGEYSARFQGQCQKVSPVSGSIRIFCASCAANDD